jgi:hypothetical protein
MANGQEIQSWVGKSLTFTGVVDVAVRIVDYYSRWEVFMTFQQQFPLLASPIVPVILLATGLYLIHNSMQRAFLESIQRTRQAAPRDKEGNVDGNRVVPMPKAPSIKPTLAVVAGGVLLAGLLALIWLIDYNPLPEVMAHSIPVPHICKTVDCWPKPAEVPHIVRPIAVHQTGENNVSQIGNNNQATIMAELWELPVDRAKTLSDELRAHPVAGAIVEVSSVNPDNKQSLSYADHIASAFKNGEWPIEGDQAVPIHMGGTLYGIRIKAKTFDSGAGKIIKDAFKSADIKAYIDPQPGFPENQVFVEIGLKP